MRGIGVAPAVTGGRQGVPGGHDAYAGHRPLDLGQKEAIKNLLDLSDDGAALNFKCFDDCRLLASDQFCCRAASHCDGLCGKRGEGCVDQGRRFFLARFYIHVGTWLRLAAASFIGAEFRIGGPSNSVRKSVVSVKTRSSAG